jgi:hypothetical protein
MLGVGALNAVIAAKVMKTKAAMKPQNLTGGGPAHDKVAATAYETTTMPPFPERLDLRTRMADGRSLRAPPDRGSQRSPQESQKNIGFVPSQIH